MPRFADNWVVDKCMFDYVNGGSCACCGLPHLFAPGGLEGMISAMSDLETDAAASEVNAARQSPWPPEMRDQIWSDRLLLRYRMKKEMKAYRKFLEGVVGDADGTDDDGVDVNDAVPILQKFCMSELSPRQLQGIFQLPRAELMEVLNSRYKICNAYGVVFCTVTEQVANFKVTGYGVDARGDDLEERFEKLLKFKKVGPGFCLDIATNLGGGGSDGEVDEEVLLVFLRRVASLAGPKLLARAAKTHEDKENDSGGEGDADGAEDTKSNVPSFRSDRRVIRLMIVRYWADRLIEKYKEIQKKKGDQLIENAEDVQ